MFVDTWAWVALAVVDDTNHQRAFAAMDALRASRAKLVTSNFVVAETLTRLRYDASLQMALRVAEEVAAMDELGRLQLVVVDGPLWQAALNWFRRFQDQRFSFVDCTSFAIMHSLGIDEALTADRHFATAGFVPLG